MTLAVVFSTFTRTAPRVCGVAVSGTRIFAMTSVAGAAMMLAVIRCLA